MTQASFLKVSAVIERTSSTPEVDPDLTSGLQSQPAWTDDVFDLFRVDRPDLLVPLLRALLRIVVNIPWLADIAGEDLADQLKRHIAHLKSQEPKWARELSREEAYEALKGERSLAGTMIGEENKPQPGIEVARVMLWLVCKRWYARRERKKTVVDAYASAIRGAVTRSADATIKAHGLAKHLKGLGSATSLEDCVKAAEVLHDSDHKGLAAAWGYMDAELKLILEDCSSALAQPQPQPNPNHSPCLRQGLTSRRLNVGMRRKKISSA